MEGPQEGLGQSFGHRRQVPLQEELVGHRFDFFESLESEEGETVFLRPKPNATIQPGKDLASVFFMHFRARRPSSAAAFDL